MDVRQLRSIVAVVDEGGVTRAAEELHIAQPSLSQTIRSLERELGVDLFERVGRRLVLTAAGESLIGPARQVLRDIETVRASVAQVRGLKAGRLDLVAEPTLAVDPVAGLIGMFRTTYPGVTVRLAEPENAAELVARVADGRSEVAVAELPLAPAGGVADGLHSEVLLVQDVLVVRPPGTETPPGAGSRHSLAVTSLAGAPLITTPLGTSSRSLVERALGAASVTPVVAVETEQREALLPLVLAGAGSALLPRPLAEQARQRGAVVMELSPPLRRTVGLAYRPGPLSPAARAFVDLARQSPGYDGGSESKARSSSSSQSTTEASTVQ
jgi:LysR family transcriptional regulator, carnitine catabolism transcriptional activator